MALIDHELGGRLKDLFAGDDPHGIFNDVRMEAMLEGFDITGHEPATNRPRPPHGCTQRWPGRSARRRRSRSRTSGSICRSC